MLKLKAMSLQYVSKVSFRPVKQTNPEHFIHSHLSEMANRVFSTEMKLPTWRPTIIFHLILSIFVKKGHCYMNCHIPLMKRNGGKK